MILKYERVVWVVWVVLKCESMKVWKYESIKVWKDGVGGIGGMKVVRKWYVSGIKVWKGGMGGMCGMKVYKYESMKVSKYERVVWVIWLV